MPEAVTEILLTETFANPVKFADRRLQIEEAGWECESRFSWNDGKFRISYWKPVKELRR